MSDNKQVSNQNEQLENLNTPEVELHNHKRSLRAALLSAHADTFNNKSIKNMLKFLWGHKILSSGGMVALVSVFVLTAALGIYPYSLDVDKANAQAVIDSAIEHVKHLDEEQRAQLQELLGTDPISALKEARKAGDLSFIGIESIDFDALNLEQELGLDELPKRLENAKVAVFEDAEGNEIKVLKSGFGGHGKRHFKVLSFTDQGGKTIQIGVAEDGTPITRTFIKNDDGDLTVTDQEGNEVEVKGPGERRGHYKFFGSVDKQAFQDEDGNFTKPLGGRHHWKFKRFGGEEGTTQP